MTDDEPLDDALLSRALTPARDGDDRWHTGAEWQRLRSRIDTEEMPLPVRRVPGRALAVHGRPLSRVLAAAAVIAIVAAGTVLLRRPAEQPLRTLSTEPGQRLSVQLSDGTAVVLGPSSTLRYGITPTQRRIELVGIAHFDVVHDTRRPFVVRAGAVEAVDLGTSFTIRALERDSIVTLAVTEGEVELRGNDSLTIGAGHVGVAKNGRTLSSDRSADQLDAWATGRLSFADTPLSEVVAELSRWFAVEVRVDDRALALRTITASYAEPTLDAVLAGIVRTTGATVVRTQQGITLRRGLSETRQ